MYVDLRDLVLALDKEFITHDEAKKLYRTYLEFQTNQNNSIGPSVAANYAVNSSSIFRA